jgi:ankyrin repeat protein
MCVRVAEVANVEALMHMKSDSGITVLMLAAQHGCNDAITTLLSSVSNPQAVAEKVDSHGYTALIVAIKNTKSISALLRGVPDAYHLIAASNAAALSYAVLYGDTLACKAMLQSVPSLSDQMCLIEKLVIKHTENENSLWWHAIIHMQSEVVKILLASVYEPTQRQALLQTTDGNGKAALHIAVNKNNIEMARNLLQGAVDAQTIIFQEDNIGMNAFMLAAKKDHTTMALIIFDKTRDKYALLKQCGKNQVHTMDLVGQKLSNALISRLTQIVNDCPQEDLKNAIQDLKNSQFKYLDIENQQEIKTD